MLSEDTAERIKSARRTGWWYGSGIGAIIALAFILGHQITYWVIPALISGVTFPALGAHLFGWMEETRTNHEP